LYGPLLFLLQNCPQLKPISKAEFDIHAQKAYPGPKRVKYDKAFKDAGNIVSKKEPNPISGKGGELLVLRPGNYVKTRLIFPYEPAKHVENDAILWSLGVKKILVEFFNSQSYDPPRGSLKPSFRIRIPQKGTNREIESFLAAVPDHAMLALLSGDDSYNLLRRGGKYLTLAADLKSCDTTLGPHIRPLLSILIKLGLPAIVANQVDKMCTGPFHWRNFVKCKDGRKGCLKGVVNVNKINASGNPMTTVITVLVNCTFQYAAWKSWDGNPNNWKFALQMTAQRLGIKVEAEDHGNKYMNPIGVDSFLSCVPIRPAGEFIVIPKSHTKALIIKGVKQRDKGRSFLVGLHQRALNPALRATHLGVAILNMFCNCLRGKPIPEGLPPPWNPYKINFEEETNPRHTVLEEIEFYNRFAKEIWHNGHEITMEDFVAEVALLGKLDLSTYPRVSSHELPIITMMAEAHYNAKLPLGAG
jgi:hypothetical protein